jgi:hypothetical protein
MPQIGKSLSQADTVVNKTVNQNISRILCEYQNSLLHFTRCFTMIWVEEINHIEVKSSSQSHQSSATQQFTSD